MAFTTINKKKTANDWINEAMADCGIAVSDECSYSEGIEKSKTSKEKIPYTYRKSSKSNLALL